MCKHFSGFCRGDRDEEGMAIEYTDIRKPPRWPETELVSCVMTQGTVSRKVMQGTVGVKRQTAHLPRRINRSCRKVSNMQSKKLQIQRNVVTIY